MITNKVKLLKEVKRDFPEFIDDKAILEDIENQLCINGGSDVELKSFNREGIFPRLIVKLYSFKQLKNGKYRFI